MIVSHLGSDRGCDEHDERMRRTLSVMVSWQPVSTQPVSSQPVSSQPGFVEAMSFIDANDTGRGAPGQRLR